jgi:hypothetical protein
MIMKIQAPVSGGLLGPNTGIGLVENGDVVDSMESAAPDVPPNRMIRQKKCNGRALSTPFA